MPRGKAVKKVLANGGAVAGKGVENGDAVVSSTTSIASEEEETSVKVASPKGRGRVKKRVTPVVEEIVEVEEDPAPVQKAAAGRGRRKLGEVKESVAVVEEKKPTARGGRVKKAAPTAIQIAVDEVEVEPKPKAKGRGRKAATAVVEQEPIPETNGEEQEEETPAKVAKTVKATGKGRKKKEVTLTQEVVPDAEAATVEKAASKRGSSKKASIAEDPEAAAEDGVADIEEDVKTEIVKPKKTSGRAKKVVEVAEVTEKPAATKRGRAKKAPIEKIVTEDASDAIEEETDDSPKKKPKKNVAAKAKPSEEKKKSTTKSKAAEDDIEEISSDNELKEEAKPSKAPPATEKKPRGARKRAAAIVEDNDDDDEADGGPKLPSKAKKAAPLNATDTIYNKADFDLPPLESSDDDERFNLKIASWNVAGLRSWLKKDGLKFLDYEEPDIFCMQETKCTTDQLPEEATRLPGYHPYWLCMPGGYAGVAIYSKIMPINVEYGIGDAEFDDAGRVITAEYEKFYLVNVYVPNSGRKLVNLKPRMRWEKLFQQFVQKLDARKPVIICGDMNVSHREIDLANPKANARNAGFTQEERDKMSELLALGFVDTFRHLYPQRKGAYSFWTYMGNARSRNVGWRLDYFITSERLIQRVVDNCLRTQCKGSDHCPITLFLKM